MICSSPALRSRYRRESPDVRDRDTVVEEQGPDHGGAHALALRLGAGGLKDDLVGAQDGIAQDDRGARQAGGGIVDAQVLALDRIAHQADDGLDGDAAGDLAGVIAAHAVGQHQQADVGIVGDGVFVVIANPTGVGLAHTTQLPLEAQPASCARHDGCHL